MRAEPKTLLAWLCDRDRLPYSRFEERFTKTGVRLFGNGTTNPTCGETQFRRWTGGKLQTLPAAPTCMVLEAMWPEYTAAQLFEPPALADPQVPANDLEERVRMTAEEALEGADATASAAVSDNTIDELRDQVEAAARQYHRMAPAQAYEALDKLRTAIERQRDRTQVPFQQQELMILNGQAAALLAVAAFDLGYFPSARSLARTPPCSARQPGSRLSRHTPTARWPTSRTTRATRPKRLRRPTAPGTRRSRGLGVPAAPCHPGPGARLSR